MLLVPAAMRPSTAPNAQLMSSPRREPRWRLSEEPTISCPASRTVSAGASTHTATLSLATATATDNSGSATVNCDRVGSVTLAIGTHQVTCTAQDPSSNTASCSYVVLVKDEHAPKVTCPQDQGATADPNSQGTAVNYPAPTATDNSLDEISVSCSAARGATFTIGTTLVTCSAQDSAGNKGGRGGWGEGGEGKGGKERSA